MVLVLNGLVCALLRWCLMLTLIKLATSATSLEFGVSRQYLRALELLLRFGQRRIERVESKNKGLHKQRPNDTDRHGQASRSSKLDRPNCLAEAANLHQPQLAAETSDEPSNCSSCADNGLELNLDARLNNGLRQNHNQRSPLQTTKPHRRISTPDGPPVFLLDDFDSYFSQRTSATTTTTTTMTTTTITTNANHNTELEPPPPPPPKHELHLADATHLIARGISDIIDDQVTKRFSRKQLETWNLLTRNNAKNYQFMSKLLGLFWFVGLLIRYIILMPLRIMFTLTGLIWLLSTMTIIGLLPEPTRDKPYRVASLMAFRMLSCGITSRLEFHNRQYRAKKGDICVANHTSPIDVVLLACDNCYALVGQRHKGLLGLLEFGLSRATKHVWFDRSEMKDRQFVTQRLREHINGGSSLPVLIFPEGTCINNSAVMMFRKGSFETTDRVCPVAMKYDPMFGDPFWDSSKQTYFQYLLMMMSSWAIKCDVWYLPPMERLEGESSAEFANRVKAEIAKQAGLPDLAWDGQLKRSAPKIVWKHQQQEDFASRLKLE